jgi:alpha-ketoglutarate-dependent taurine dioxygenase
MQASNPRIPHKPGWSGDVLSKDGICVDLGAEQHKAIAELLQRKRDANLAWHQLRYEDFTHPALDALLSDFLHQLRSGPGIAVLRGIPVDQYSLEEVEAIYWGIGSHFGDAVSQSAAGDLLGRVTDLTDPKSGKAGRGYQSARELRMHTDSAETVGLLCVRPAKSGGENVFASALRVYEIIESERPDCLEVLKQGFPYHRRGEGAADAEPITPYNVPVFSDCNGLTSCRYAEELFLAAFAELGRSLTRLEQEALTMFNEVALRPGVRFDLQLEAGEAVFLNNFEILHSRNEFEDWQEPERRRMLLRLWLQGRPPRAMKREMHAYQNQDGRQGIDHQPGREPGTVGYAVVRDGKIAASR